MAVSLAVSTQYTNVTDTARQQEPRYAASLGWRRATKTSISKRNKRMILIVKYFPNVLLDIAFYNLNRHELKSRYNVDRPLTTSLGINSTKVERETDRDRRWWFEETLNKHAATQRQSINQSSFITSNSATIHSALQTLRDITTLVDNGRSRSRICTSSKTLSLSCMRSSLWEAALCIVCLYVRLFRFCCSKRTGYCLHSTLTLCI